MKVQNVHPQQTWLKSAASSLWRFASFLLKRTTDHTRTFFIFVVWNSMSTSNLFSSGTWSLYRESNIVLKGRNLSAKIFWSNWNKIISWLRSQTPTTLRHAWYWLNPAKGIGQIGIQHRHLAVQNLDLQQSLSLMRRNSRKPKIWNHNSFCTYYLTLSGAIKPPRWYLHRSVRVRHCWSESRTADSSVGTWTPFQSLYCWDSTRPQVPRQCSREGNKLSRQCGGRICSAVTTTTGTETTRIGLL